MNKMKAVEDFLDEIKAFLKKNGFEFIDTYSNGEFGFWGFDKKREVEISFKLNEIPDEDSVIEFEEQIGYIESLKEDTKPKGL